MRQGRAVAMNATVKDVMTTHVVAVRMNAPFKDMAARLREQRVSAFPVLDDDNKVVGVVSEADLLAKEALEYSTPGVVGGILHHLSLIHISEPTRLGMISYAVF